MTEIDWVVRFDFAEHPLRERQFIMASLQSFRLSFQALTVPFGRNPTPDELRVISEKVAHVMSGLFPDVAFSVVQVERGPGGRQVDG